MALTDRSPPLARGAAGGALAYLVGYVLVYAVAAGRIENSLLERVATGVTGEPTTWKLVGWVFYNAHFVDVRVSVDVPVLGGTDVVNFIGGGETFSQVLYVVPPILLIGAGLLVGWTAGVDDLTDAVGAGLSVALGYLPLSVAGVFLFTVAAGNAVGQPVPLTGMLLAGVVYPAAFGVVGALVALLA